MIAVFDMERADGKSIVEAINRTGLTGRNRDEELMDVIDDVIDHVLGSEGEEIEKLSNELREASMDAAHLREQVFDLEFQNDDLKDLVQELTATLAESRGDA